MKLRFIFVLVIMALTGCSKQPVAMVDAVGESVESSSVDGSAIRTGTEKAEDVIARVNATRQQSLPLERTPEEDPNVTRIGPKLGVARKLASASVSGECFSPEGRFVVYHDRSKVRGLDLNQEDPSAKELTRFPFTPRDIRVLNEDLDLIVLEAESEQPGRWSSDDPMRIWWVDHAVKEKQLLRGPEKDLSLAEAVVSPDLRFVAFHQWQDNADEQGLTKALFILDRNDGSTLTIQVPKIALSVIGWKTIDAGLRAIAVTNRGRIDEPETSEKFLVDPTNGTLENVAAQEPHSMSEKSVSPDGKFHVRIEPEEVVVTSTVGGEERRFVLHADDRQFTNEECVEWASPRYLKFNGPRLALIDVTTMKMSFPSSSSGLKIKPQTCRFSPDFHWVLFRAAVADSDEGLFVAPVAEPRS